MCEFMKKISIVVPCYNEEESLPLFYDAVEKGGADAVLAASLFHFKEMEIMDLKKYLRGQGVEVRL